MFEKTVWQGQSSAIERFKSLDAKSATAQDKDDARALAKNIATGLVATNGRSIYSGNLRLYTDAQGNARIGLKSFWHNSHNDAANELVKKLVEIGYADHPKGAQDALETYLGRTGNKMGSQSFFKLVQKHENWQARQDSQWLDGPLGTGRYRRDGFLSQEARINTDHLDYVEIVCDPDESQNGSTVLDNGSLSQRNESSVQGGNNPSSVIDPKELDSQPQPVNPGPAQESHQEQDEPGRAAPYQPPTTLRDRNTELNSVLRQAGIGSPKPLGKGGMASAFTAQMNGQTVVVKTINKAFPFTLNRLGRYDASSEGLGNIGHSVYLSTPSKRLPEFAQNLSIAAPTHYLIRRNPNTPLELLTAADAKAVLKQQRTDDRMTAVCEGEVMPMADGVSMAKHLDRKTLSDEQQAKVCSNLLEFGKEMSARGLIHRDLKPENMNLDPATGKLSVFDWDFAYKVSDRRGPYNLPTLQAGSPFYVSPKVWGAKRYAGEADMHSMGMIMLDMRYPRIFQQIAQSMYAGMAGHTLESYTRAIRGLSASLRPQQPGEVNPENFVDQLTQRIGRLEQDFTQDMAALEVVRNELQSQLDQINQEPESPTTIEEAAPLNKQLGRTNAKLADARALLDEVQRFLQESGVKPNGEDSSQSLTHLALQCLKDANEQSSATWYQRDQAQAIYQSKLDHPALQSVRPQSQAMMA